MKYFVRSLNSPLLWLISLLHTRQRFDVVVIHIPSRNSGICLSLDAGLLVTWLCHAYDNIVMRYMKKPFNLMYCSCRSWFTGFENWSIHHGMFYWLSGGSQIFSCVSNFLVGCEPSCVSTCTNGLHDCYVPISNFWNMFNFQEIFNYTNGLIIYD